MSRADRIVLTEVDMAPQGDAVFPALDASWKEVSRETPERGPRDEAGYTVKVLERG
jgi:dihydrofolate reductase